ncbi:hypothetical protein [Lacrimispora brassicae]
MNNDFENLNEYKIVLEVAKKQEELHKSVIKTYEAMSPETLAEFQEIITRVNKLRDISNMPGLLKMAEMLKNYEHEIRDNEGLTELEFEEKYREEIERSEKLGRNGWVISEHSNPADIKNWEQLLCDGESKVAEFFDGDGIAILEVIVQGLKEKYITDVNQLYFNKGIEVFEDKDYMTAAMYLFALLDYRVNQLVDFPNKCLKNKDKYSNKGFVNQKTKDFKKLTERRGLISKKIYFLDKYPSLIEYLNRIFYDEPYPFHKGIEPPYLNRNWLMHGRMTRRIEKYECIQILNALSVIEFMF